jgi:hypothetical protein
MTAKSEEVTDLTVEDIVRLKNIVAKGSAYMCWLAPNRKEVKGLIKIAEKYFGIAIEKPIIRYSYYDAVSCTFKEGQRPKEKKHGPDKAV